MPNSTSKPQTTVSTTSVSGEASDTYTKYCPFCQSDREMIIEDSERASYHDDETSVIKCSSCGRQMGHLVWWPSLREGKFPDSNDL